MYKRIAVAVDGGASSEAALEEAIKLAREMDAKVLLLHVCEEMPMVLDPEGMGLMQINDITKAITAAGRSLLEKYRNKLEGQGMVAETKLIETYDGRVGSAASHEAQLWNADLLVVGTHGRKGVDRLLLGSVAEDISRSATMPVLLVHVKN
jgi:nucleotide-binding universal stress UspA family protein